jgi:hypothetical protein
MFGLAVRKFSLRKKVRSEVLAKYRLAAVIGGAVGVALILTFISLLLYTLTGTAALDLSRPGYEDARQKVKREASGEAFDATGSIDKAVIDEYLTRYRKKQQPLQSYDSFDPNIISDTQLNLDDPAAVPNETVQ